MLTKQCLLGTDPRGSNCSVARDDTVHAENFMQACVIITQHRPQTLIIKLHTDRRCMQRVKKVKTKEIENITDNI